jgi:DNA uptake protein ComE-like DNA-binding protein
MEIKMHKSLFAALVLAAAVSGSAFAQAPSTAPATTPAAKPQVTAPAPTAPAATTPARPAATLIDINSASLTELQTLKGIGAARAEAIVKGRPFKGKDDLLAKKIVPENVYNDIKDSIIARQKN